MLVTMVVMMITWVRKLKKERLLGGGASSIGTWFLCPISIWSCLVIILYTRTSFPLQCVCMTTTTTTHRARWLVPRLSVYLHRELLFCPEQRNLWQYITRSSKDECSTGDQKINLNQQIISINRSMSLINQKILIKCQLQNKYFEISIICNQITKNNHKQNTEFTLPNVKARLKIQHASKT